MPSKIQHEIDKLRGKIAETGQVYKDTMADLEDQVDAVSKNILAVETDLKGSIRKTKSDAKSEASHAANSSLPSSGGSMNGEVDMSGHDITGISDFEAEDSGGIGFYNENSVLTLGIDSSGNLTPQGSVDGMDIAAYKTLIDAIEAGATADQTNTEIRDAVEAATDSNTFNDADHTKLNAIEASATADQTNTEIRDAVEAATDSNTFNDTDHTKLNAIEASATADQTNTEIRDAVEAATDSNTFNDADHTKLNGVATGADVTADNVYVVDDNTLHSNDTQQNTINNNYTKLKETVYNGNSRTIRICFTLMSRTAATISGVIYINGGLVGTELIKTAQAEAWFTQVDDLAVDDGDLVQVYIKTSNSSQSAIVKDFRIRGTYQYLEFSNQDP